jgi:hypothetical protein
VPRERTAFRSQRIDVRRVDVGLAKTIQLRSQIVDAQQQDIRSFSRGSRGQQTEDREGTKQMQHDPGRGIEEGNPSVKPRVGRAASHVKPRAQRAAHREATPTRLNPRPVERSFRINETPPENIDTRAADERQRGDPLADASGWHGTARHGAV